MRVIIQTYRVLVGKWKGRDHLDEQVEYNITMDLKEL
jgi:hypothetical protein